MEPEIEMLIQRVLTQQETSRAIADDTYEVEEGAADAGVMPALLALSDAAFMDGHRREALAVLSHAAGLLVAEEAGSRLEGER